MGTIVCVMPLPVTVVALKRCNCRAIGLQAVLPLVSVITLASAIIIFLVLAFPVSFLMTSST